jgi:hypothetical protein
MLRGMLTAYSQGLKRDGTRAIECADKRRYTCCQYGVIENSLSDKLQEGVI